MLGTKKLFLPALLVCCAVLVMTLCACEGAPGEGAPVCILLPSPEAEVGAEFEARVYVEVEERGISAGEILLTFDADTMEVVSIEPGDLLGSDPLVGLREIDNNAGTVKYAIARVGATSVPTPPGVFAILKFKVLESAKSGTYELNLSKVDLADEEFEDIVGIEAEGASIKVTS